MTNYWGDKARGATQISRCRAHCLLPEDMWPHHQAGEVTTLSLKQEGREAIGSESSLQHRAEVFMVSDSLCTLEKLIHDVKMQGSCPHFQCSLNFFQAPSRTPQRLSRCLVSSRTLTTGILRGLHSSHKRQMGSHTSSGRRES